VNRVDINTKDGTCPSYVYVPTEDGPWPAVLVFMDGIGIRSAVLEIGLLPTMGPKTRALAPRYVTTTVNVGRAMIRVAASGYSKQILRSDDINRVARSPAQAQ
jgi:hypothetical protein